MKRIDRQGTAAISDVLASKVSECGDGFCTRKDLKEIKFKEFLETTNVKISVNP